MLPREAALEHTRASPCSMLVRKQVSKITRKESTSSRHVSVLQNALDLSDAKRKQRQRVFVSAAYPNANPSCRTASKHTHMGALLARNPPHGNQIHTHAYILRVWIHFLLCEHLLEVDEVAEHCIPHKRAGLVELLIRLPDSAARVDPHLFRTVRICRQHARKRDDSAVGSKYIHMCAANPFNSLNPENAPKKPFRWYQNRQGLYKLTAFSYSKVDPICC